MNTLIFTLAVVLASVSVTLTSISWMRSAKRAEMERYQPIRIPVWLGQNEIGAMMIEEMLVTAFRQAIKNSDAFTQEMTPDQEEQLFSDLLEISHSYAEGMVRRFTEPDTY